MMRTAAEPVTERRQPLRRGDLAAAATLVLLVATTRVPFRTTMLYNWDSANFALALDHFDVTRHFPHPPGYFYYVALARAIRLLVGDANTSLVAEGIIFSALAVVTLYFLGRQCFDRPAGVVAALLLTFSVTYWSLGTVALPYVSLAFFSAAMALLAYRAVFGGSDEIVWPSVVYALGGGFRPDLLLFLGPLWALSMIGKPLRRVVLGTAVVVAGFLLWYVPTVWLSGGIEGYHSTLLAYLQVDVAQKYSTTHKGLSALLVNVRDTLSYLFYALYFTAIPLLLGAAYAAYRTVFGDGGIMPGWRGWQEPVGLGAEPAAAPPTIPVGRRTSAEDRRSATSIKLKLALFVACWIGPMLAFYIFIHVGDPGYVFTILPALLLFAARALTWPLKMVPAAARAHPEGGEGVSPLPIQEGVYNCSPSAPRSAGGEGCSPLPMGEVGRAPIHPSFTAMYRGRAQRGRVRASVVVALLTSLVLAGNIGVALLHPRQLTLVGIRASDEVLRHKIKYITASLPAESSLLVAYETYRHLQYYLPQYSSVWIDIFDPREQVVGISPTVDRVALVDERLQQLSSWNRVREGGAGIQLVLIGQRDEREKELVYAQHRLALR